MAHMGDYQFFLAIVLVFLASCGGKNFPASGKIGDGKSIDIGGGEMLTFRYVPSGRFTMGSPKSEVGRSDNEDQVAVELTSHYWMGETEVTQGQWQAVMGGNPSYFKGSRDLPVEQVSWKDAQEFLAKLNAKELLPAGWKWVLPTEAQWERACWGGTTTVFAFGDRLSSMEANFDGKYPYGCAAKGVYLEKTAVVKSYRSNAYGLYDMHGNVWEWCADWYGEVLPGGKDPTGPTTGSDRVIRGGCWRNSSANCRSANRDRFTPGDRICFLGFRLAVVPAEG